MSINTKDRLIKHSENQDDLISKKQEVHNFFFAYEATEYQQNKIVAIVDNYITEYALTHDEIEDGLNHVDAWERIYNYRMIKTRNKKDRISGGMFWEAILFNILKEYFPSAKKLVTKIRQRTANKMEINGFDCAHYCLDSSQQLTLWLWESKFYKDFSSALADAYQSLLEHLNITKIEEEFTFLTPNLEIISQEEKKVIKNLIKWNKDYVNFEIPVLLTYDLSLINDYKNNEDFKIDEKVKKDYERKFKSILRKKFVDINTTMNIKFKFILLPFKDISAVKELFIKKRDSYNY